MTLLQPKEVEIPTMDGSTRTYVISKFPATDGREIVAQYPFSILPKVGDYKLNETLMLKIMCFVGVPGDGAPLMLTTKALVNNHVPDWEALARLELAIMDYNTSFFRDGRASTFLAGLGAKAGSKITEMLTGLLANLSQATRPPSTNSEQSTASKMPSSSGKQS